MSRNTIFVFSMFIHYPICYLVNDSAFLAKTTMYRTSCCRLFCLCHLPNWHNKSNDLHSEDTWDTVFVMTFLSMLFVLNRYILNFNNKELLSLHKQRKWVIRLLLHSSKHAGGTNRHRLPGHSQVDNASTPWSLALCILQCFLFSSGQVLSLSTSRTNMTALWKPAEYFAYRILFIHTKGRDLVPW
jgi:hypothetical protein